MKVPFDFPPEAIEAAYARSGIYQRLLKEIAAA